MQSLADSGVFWGLLIAGIIAVYMLPTIIGLIRGVDHLALVFVVNLLGAPTWAGWFAAMILGFGPRSLPPAPPCRHRSRIHGRRTMLAAKWRGAARRPRSQNQQLRVLRRR